MTLIEELKSKAGWHGHEHISGLLLKAATEIESLQKDLDDLRRQNAELRESLQMVKDEDLRCWQEVAEVGHTEFNYSARMANAVNKALAAQPEVKP